MNFLISSLFNHSVKTLCGQKKKCFPTSYISVNSLHFSHLEQDNNSYFENLSVEWRNQLEKIQSLILKSRALHWICESGDQHSSLIKISPILFFFPFVAPLIEFINAVHDFIFTMCSFASPKSFFYRFVSQCSWTKLCNTVKVI